MLTEFDVARVLYEARIREAWGSMAEDRLAKLPFPDHAGAPRTAEVDLAIAQAKAVMRLCPAQP